jgi:hypothetical protein
MIRTTLLAAAALLLLPGAASAQKMCDQVRTNTTTSPAPLTEKVAAVPNKRIYLCGYMIVRAGVDPPGDLQFQIVSGTGRDCLSNKNIIIPQMAVPASGVLVNRIAYAAGEKTPPGHAICLQVFGNGPALISTFYWAQF